MTKPVRPVLLALVALACGALVACDARPAASDDPPGGPARAPDAERPRDPDSPPPALAIDEAMVASVRTGVVREQDLPQRITVAGKVQFDEDRVRRVLAPLAGQVVDLHVKVGDVVRAGQRLCTINSREVAAALGEHLEAHKDLDLAEKTAAMTEDLFEHQAASKLALQQSQNDLAKARGRVTRTEEALHVLGLRPDDTSADRLDGRVPIPSPIAGTVIERRVTDGEFVQTDSMPMITVADLSSVWVVGDIIERELRRVSVGDKATITAAAYPGETFQGRVDYISDVIDPATRTAKVRVSVPNPVQRLKPEMFASIVLAGGPERALAVPAAAVFTEDGRTWVYVATTPRTFVRRAVRLAGDEGASRRVLSGLEPGERIVVDGALLLRDEERKKIG